MVCGFVVLSLRPYMSVQTLTRLVVLMIGNLLVGLLCFNFEHKFGLVVLQETAHSGTVLY